MSRTVWFVAGAGMSVWAMVKARRAAEALTPEGLSDRLAGLQAGWEVFAAEVTTGREESETQLRERLLPGVHGGERRLALPPGTPAPRAHPDP